MVAGAFGAGTFDDAAAVHPDAPVSDEPSLDRHRGAEPHSGCEFPPGVADDRVSGVLPGFDAGPPEFISVYCVVPDHEPTAGRQVAAQETGPGFRQGLRRFGQGIQESAKLGYVVPARLLEAEHRVARIGDEVLPARVPAGGWAYGQPAPEVFAFSRIEPQPDEGEHAAPVRDAVCPVQVTAMDVHLGRYPQKARQVEQAGGLR